MTIDVYKKYYNKSLFDKNSIAIFTANGKLTAEQYKEITGDDYTPVVVESVIDELKTGISNNEFAVNLTGAAAVSRIEDIETDIAALKGGA